MVGGRDRCVVCAFLVVFALAGCADKAGEITLDATSAQQIVVSNPNGPISLFGLAGSSSVEVRYSVHSEDGEATSDAVQVMATALDGLVNVLATTEHAGIWVDLEVVAPPQLVFTLTTGPGDVLLEAMVGGGTVGTGTGTVAAAGLAGSLDVAVQSGWVDLETSIGTNDTVAVNLGDGAITLTVPGDTNALLAASTDGGGTVVIDGLDFSGDGSDTSANGKLGDGGDATITLHTGLGDVRVQAVSLP